jgi:4-amino-4-deoxy-L-arabinose transferase-like glycosyltransferase
LSSFLLSPFRKFHSALLNAISSPIVQPQERLCLWVLGALAAILRITAILTMRVDSDEPQHLHVAWGWAHGLLQYRDIFDNHTPLFHLSMAPFVRLFGETPCIMYYMRSLMLVIFIVMLFAIYGIVRSFLHHRAAVWATVFAALVPPFFLTSAEFRTDDMWVMWQLVALWVLVSGPLTPRRGLLGGLILGISLGTSFKTTMLLLSAVVALILLIAFSAEFRRTFSWKKTGKTALALVAGTLLVPVLLILLFHYLQILDAATYCIIKHSILPPSTQPSPIPLKTFGGQKVLVLLISAFFCCGAWRIGKAPIADGTGIRATWLILICTVYFFIMKMFYPVLQAQTRLSYYPLIMFALILSLWAFPRREEEASPAVRWKILPFLAVLEMTAILTSLHPLNNRARETQLFLGEVLRLTDPTDFLMDPKGETVFRNRPWYYGFERFTKERVQRKLLKDDMVETCIKTRTCVAINASITKNIEGAEDFMEHDRHLMEKIYIPVGRLSVVGKYIFHEPQSSAIAIPFQVDIPVRYALITATGNATGTLDGKPYSGPLELSAGEHTYVPTSGETSVAMVWAQAVERGFSPFTPTVTIVPPLPKPSVSPAKAAKKKKIAATTAKQPA